VVPEAKKQQLTALITVAQRILEELNERNIPALRLRAALSINNQDQLNHLFSDIGDRLSSDTPDDVIEALHAIDIIAEKEADEIHTIIISKAMVVLSQKIYWRHAADLSISINVMIRLVKEFPSRFINTVEELTLSGLHHIAKESNYTCSAAELAERINIRYEAAGLAATISSIYSSSEKEIPKTIQDWKSICQSPDEFAEIRNQWEFHQSDESEQS
jgi:hypothetical protein